VMKINWLEDAMMWMCLLFVIIVMFLYVVWGRIVCSMKGHFTACYNVIPVGDGKLVELHCKRCDKNIKVVTLGELFYYDN
jgi:hypothetical protein